MGLSKLLKSHKSVGHPEYHKATEKCYHLVVLYVLHAHSVFFCSHIQPPELKIEVNMEKVEVPPGATPGATHKTESSLNAQFCSIKKRKEKNPMQHSTS